MINKDTLKELKDMFGEDYISQVFSEAKNDVMWSMILQEKKLPEQFIEKHKDEIGFFELCFYGNLSESFIEKNKVSVLWDVISMKSYLSENFIDKYKKKLHWEYITKHQFLSQKFIEQHTDYICWSLLADKQALTEDFIEQNIKILNSYDVSSKQKLSEEFIEKHSNELIMDVVSRCQKLSETFIEKNWEILSWENISKYQHLSEEFIKNNSCRFKEINIVKYQKLSKEYVDNILDRHPNYSEFVKDNWLYKTTEEKKQAVINTGKYECHDDYFIAYKAVKPNRYSIYNFQYKYEKGGVYESWCDCTEECNSFGLNASNEKYAHTYGETKNRPFIVIRCKVRYEDVGRVAGYGEKIRCFKIEILD